MCPPCLSFSILILSLRYLVTFYQFRLAVTGTCTRQTGVFPRSFTQGGGGQVKGDKANWPCGQIGLSHAKIENIPKNFFCHNQQRLGRHSCYEGGI